MAFSAGEPTHHLILPLVLQVVVKHLSVAHEQIDAGIAAALRMRKPVYINIACNLAGQKHPTFDHTPIPFCIFPKVQTSPDQMLSSDQVDGAHGVGYVLQISNKRSLEAAVEAAAEFLNSKGMVAIVAGVKVPFYALYK